MQCSHVLQSKPHLCSAFANQALTTQEYFVALPTWSLQLHLVLWPFAGGAGGEAAHKNWTHVCTGKVLLHSWRSPCQMQAGARSALLAASLLRHYVCHHCVLFWNQVNTIWSTLTKQASLLVSRGFIYMFFSLIRKENSKNWKRMHVSNSRISSSYDSWSNTRIPVCTSKLAMYFFCFFRSECVKYL